MTTDTTDARVERYRRAERAFWDHFDLAPTEQFIDLDRPRVRIRVQEVGSGEPVLFVPGTGGTGPYWGPLVRELPRTRWLLIDRPGWGLSSTLDYARHEYKTVATDVLRRLLDALGLNRASIVGSSIGNVWALSLASLHPARADRVCLLGGGPIVPEISVPPAIRLLATPIGALMVRLSSKPGITRAQLRQLGHGPSLEGGHLDGYVPWRTAMIRETDSMRNEPAMVRAVVGWRGFRRPLTFDATEIASIERPTLMVYGTADPVGTVHIWRRILDGMPRAELHLMEGVGHEPWFDEPGQVAEIVGNFLAGDGEPSHRR